MSRKREGSAAQLPTPKRQRVTVQAKSSLFDSVDSQKPAANSAKNAQLYLDQLDEEGDSDTTEDDGSEEDIFENVPGLESTTDRERSPQDLGADEDEELDWEDAIHHGKAAEEVQIADVSISVTEDGTYATATDRAASTVRKGPSKRERQVRNGTHCVHVQSLVWHNVIRNSWLNDPDLHRILLDGLPEGVRIEIDRYRADMGMTDVTPLSTSKKKRGLKGRKQTGDNRSARDWESDANRVDVGMINRSGGDPTLRLLKLLTAFWRKRFTIAAPGLRKLGYMSIKRLARDINSWKKDRLDVEKHGERLEDRTGLQESAKACQGSRDIGSQLFTALLRALGLEARMVASLQPAGIGWGKAEEAKAAKQSSVTVASNKSEASPATKSTKRAATQQAPPSQKREVISLDSDDDSNLSSPPSDLEDDASVVDITDRYESKTPKKRYDRDLAFPHYWTEVLSPISNTYVPVDPIVLSTVATNAELVATFEPRGKAADQAKQVMCYAIAHSPDGTAKEVTVRYLKKHQLPGRTKGYRIPVEKIKVYNKKGKVLRYEDYDWFKTVMSPLARPHNQRTPADDLEESTDLKPYSADTEKPKADVESLQWYKQSAEFVLERHLRREEALPPMAKPVRSFMNGKGEKAAAEPVYRRADVVACKTAESWHKEGREIKFGEQPMKLVPMRAVTTMRKREMEEVERTTGEKAKQGLFARHQTDWIIPPPIGEDREIPRNAFGNIDVYVPSMVPDGAVHLKLKGAARVCRDLGISHAEAVTGFEFGRRMAVPVITGVVVAKENKHKVLELWREREVEKKAKEAKKKSEQCLVLWRKMCSGLRIMERMRREYAGKGTEEDINPFVKRANAVASGAADGSSNAETPRGDAGDGGGGFMQSDDDAEDDETADIDLGGGFFVEKEEQEPLAVSTTHAVDGAQPVSLRATHETQQFVFDVPTPSPPASTRDAARTSPSPPSIAAKKQRKPAQPKTAIKKSRVTPRAKPKQTPPKSKSRRGQTGTRSKFFPAAESGSSSPHSDIKDESEGGEDAAVALGDDDESEESVVEEVTRPRRTTARTRGL